MNDASTLPGSIRVLVTRPAHQSAHMNQLLTDAAGISTLSLPTIEIKYVKTDVDAALQSDITIFTSVNSVIGAHHCKTLPWQFSGMTAAIGSATTKALKNHGVTVDLQPANSAGSEALLQVLESVIATESATLSDYKITIVRGDHGREKLYESLTAGGATVEYLGVYQRDLPSYSQASLKSVFDAGLPDIISLTSDLGLINLIKIVPEDLQSQLKKCHLVVNSERCASLARDNGFSEKIVVADPPGDKAQVTEILRMADQLANK